MASIFQRLFSTYLAVTVLLVLLIAALLSHFIDESQLRLKQRELMVLGTEVNELVNTRANQINQVNIQRIVNNLSSASSNKIYIVRSQTDLNKVTKGVIKNHLEQDYPRIMAGQTIIQKKQFANFFKADMVFVGMPLRQDGKITGAILLYSSLKEVKKIVRPIILIIWISAAIFLLLATFVIFLLSRRLSSPIIQLSQAAEEIAAGNYSTPLDIRGKDEIAQLGKSFNYMREQIKTTEQMRQELLANISHEMRTPLTSIRGFIQAILDGVVKEDDQRKYLKLSYQEAGRLAKLTTDLLDVAKLRTGHLKLNKEVIDLTTFLQEQVDNFELSCAEKGIKLNTIFLSNTTILVDRDRLAQVIINLFHNALKFTAAGGEITLSSRLENKKVLIEVTDTGVGISEQELPHIFDHFYKVDKSRDARNGGSGIGLYLVKEFVHLHGGTIKVSSEVGQGTTFTIEL